MEDRVYLDSHMANLKPVAERRTATAIAHVTIAERKLIKAEAKARTITASDLIRRALKALGGPHLSKLAAVAIFLVAVCVAACKGSPPRATEGIVTNRAIDLETTANPSATCHDWGRNVGSAGIDYAWCGAQGVWQVCAVAGMEQGCKIVIDPRPAPPAAAKPVEAPPPAKPVEAPPTAPVGSGSAGGAK